MNHTRAASVLLLACCCLALASSATAHDQFFDSDGVQIRYVDRGRGEPVVLLHGFTMDVESWNRGDILRSLAQNYRVVALDCRGHGKSGKPHDPARYGANMAADVLRLMDHLQIPKAHLVGYSMGSRLAAYLLANHPNRLITATLGATPPRRIWDAVAEELVSGVAARMQKMGKDPRASSSQDYVALEVIPPTWRSWVVNEHQLRAAAVPVLAIVGSKDSADRIDGLNELKDLLPSLNLVMIDGATHSGDEGAVNRPEFLESLKKFLAASSAKD